MARDLASKFTGVRPVLRWIGRVGVIGVGLLVGLLWLVLSQPVVQAQTDCQNAPAIEQNQRPSDILLDGSVVIENSPADTVIGNLSAVDPDQCDSFTYNLIDNPNGRFKLDGSKLELFEAGKLNYSQRTSYSIAVRATDRGGLGYNKEFIIWVVPVYPDLSQPPRDATIGMGKSATLEVTASGSEPLTYQWYEGQAGDTSQPITDATEAKLVTPPLNQDTSFWVRLSNPAGTLDSPAAAITVKQPPAIKTQPPSLTIKSGNLASLQVEADGEPPLTYQWYEGPPGDTSQPITTATQPSFISPALVTNTTYWVQVANAGGATNSQAAVITVNQPPSITIQPGGATVKAGQSAKLKVAATGSEPLFYQWYLGAPGDTSHPMENAIGTEFSTPALTNPTAFWVRVSNVAGTADSQPAIVGVNQPPSITKQAGNPLINLNQTATLQIEVTGSGPFTYQWYAGKTGDTTNPLEGATTISYTTPSLQQNAYYWVRVSGPGGAADSQTIFVAVNQPPTITLQPIGMIARRNQVVTLHVAATGARPFSYQWYEGQPGDTSHPITNATSADFTSPALISDTNFWVRVSNVSGQADSEVSDITVNQPPTITSQPAPVSLDPGGRATLSVKVSGTEPFSYNWYQGQTGDISQPISDVDAPSYTTPALKTTTTYWVRVSNQAGLIDSQTVTVTVNQPPAIKRQPSGLTLARIQQASLTVEVSGSAPLTYQWYYGQPGDTTKAVPDSNGATLTTPVLLTDTTFWVRVSNKLGQVDSQPATVQVSLPLSSQLAVSSLNLLHLLGVTR